MPSRSSKPVESPISPSARVCAASISAMVSRIAALIWTTPVPRMLLVARSDSCLPASLNSSSARRPSGSCPRSANGSQGDELALDGVLANDAGIGAHVGGARCVVGNGAQVRRAPGLFKLAPAFQVIGQRHRVERSPGVRQALQGGEDGAMVTVEEVLARHQLCRLIPGGVVPHETAQQ